MTTIRDQDRLDKIIETGGRWYSPEDCTITRRMKDPEKLIAFADKIARLYFIPNKLDGRGGYQGGYEYRKNLWNRGEDEGYYAVIKDEYDVKDSVVTGNATIMKKGNFWYYTLTGVYIHKDKPMLFY